MSLQLQSVPTVSTLAVINDNFSKIEQELKNKVSYRAPSVGDENTHQTVLDMDGNAIINVSGLSVTGELTFDGHPLTQLCKDAISAVEGTAQYEGSVNAALETAVASTVASAVNIAIPPAVAAALQVPLSNPAFSAYKSANITLGFSNFEKIVFNIETQDLTNAYNSATGVFQPNVAGNYLVSASIDASAAVSVTRLMLSIFKNGFEKVRLYDQAGTQIYGMARGTAMVYMNGTTDYIDARAYIDAATRLISAYEPSTNFSAIRISNILTV